MKDFWGVGVVFFLHVVSNGEGDCVNAERERKRKREIERERETERRTGKHMTRRAFLSSRVIQAQGKFTLRRLVKIFGKWVRKMKNSQNP